MSKVLEKVLSRFSYVKNLEEENGKLHDAVEKNCRRADRMGQDLEYYKKRWIANVTEQNSQRLL